jgi:hypothetical protein
MLDHHFFFKLISHTLRPCTSWKKTSKEYQKGLQKDDVVKSFLVHLKKIGPICNWPCD